MNDDTTPHGRGVRWLDSVWPGLLGSDIATYIAGHESLESDPEGLYLVPMSAITTQAFDDGTLQKAIDLLAELDWMIIKREPDIDSLACYLTATGAEQFRDKIYRIRLVRAEALVSRFEAALTASAPEPEPKYQKRPIPASVRWQVWQRDDFTCRHCGRRNDLSVDHILPEIQGGPMDLDNLQTLCRPCNSRKGAR